MRRLGKGKQPLLEPVQTRTNVVARDRMEAMFHKNVPALRAIMGGMRLVAKTVQPVPAYPKWWIVEMDWQPLNLRWLPVGKFMFARKVKRIKHV